MPRIDIAQAKREALLEADPIVLVLGGRDYTFPAAMPAEVELAQMALTAEVKRRGLTDDSEAPADLNWNLVRAAYGGDVLDELQERQVPESDVMIGFATLYALWMQAFSDPTLPQRLIQQAQARGRLARQQAMTSSNGSSRNGGPRSKPTSSASTGSTSRTPSSSSASRGGASPPFTAG